MESVFSHTEQSDRDTNKNIPFNSTQIYAAISCRNGSFKYLHFVSVVCIYTEAS